MVTSAFRGAGLTGDGAGLSVVDGVPAQFEAPAEELVTLWLTVTSCYSWGLPLRRYIIAD
jgi:hypothetical protein